MRCADIYTACSKLFKCLVCIVLFMLYYEGHSIRVGGHISDFRLLSVAIVSQCAESDVNHSSADHSTLQGGSTWCSGQSCLLGQSEIALVGVSVLFCFYNLQFVLLIRRGFLLRS